MTVIIIILAISVVLLAIGLLFSIIRRGITPKVAEAPPPIATIEEPAGQQMIKALSRENDKGVDRELFVRCCRYMELRKPFLVESFSLDDLALAMFTNKLYLSQTINACTGRNFRNFVNNYRVLYAMELFKKNNRLRVSDLSNLSGFHSPVTFNMAFKLMMDEAPGAWCIRVRLQNQRKTNPPTK
jgi:AraC-like DNA-binding protein